MPSQFHSMALQPVPPVRSAIGLHCASVSIQVGGAGAGTGRSRLCVLYEKRIGAQMSQPFSRISLEMTGSR